MVDPVLQLVIISLRETLCPVVHNLVVNLETRTDDRFCGQRQTDCVLFTYNFHADLVAVIAVDRAFYVDQDVALGPHERQLRVVQTVSCKLRVARRQHFTADKLLVEQPAELVNLVDEHVGPLHGVGKSGCDARRAADAVRYQRLAQLTVIQNGLDPAVIRVIAAHKADLH